MTPVLRPPSREETDAWLRREAGAPASQAAGSAASAGGSSAEAEGSGFVMDPNTGKLVRS